MFGFLSNLFAGRKNRGRKGSYRLQFDTLEQRDVPSVASSGGLGPGTPPPNSPVIGVTPEGLALINGLPDETVRSTALADYQRDGCITRNDMIDIFHAATADGYLTPDVVSSLQTLVQNGAVVMPDYVQNLASKVINGAAGVGPAPAQTIDQNVLNFFEGLVRPALPSVGSDGLGGAIYKQVSEVVPSQDVPPLWDPASGPSPWDVRGHWWADTRMESALAEVAYRNPLDIGGMFIDNGDGTYTVRFHNPSTNRPDYVTVDTELPYVPVSMNADGTPNLAPYGIDPQPYLWAALAEKAFLQEYGGSYHTRYTTSPLWAITGLPERSFSPVDLAAIRTAWSRGNFVILTANIESQDGFLNSYALVGVPDAAHDWFTVTRNGTLYEVPSSDLAADFFWWQEAGPTAAAQIASAGAGAQLPVVTQLPVRPRHHHNTHKGKHAHAVQGGNLLHRVANGG